MDGPDDPDVVDPDGPWPSIGRVTDYVLGGTDHLQVDREFSAEMLEVIPGLLDVLSELRDFGARMVTHLASRGIDQFVDLGSGIPSVRPTHEVAAAAGVSPRVVYVDHDPDVIARARRHLDGVDDVVAVLGDAGAAEAFLADPGLTGTLDLSRPVAVLACAILQYVDDDAAAATVAALRRTLSPGSWLVVAALSGDGRTAAREWAQREHGGPSGVPRLREPSRMRSWLDGWELAGPGWVAAPSWRPDATDGPTPAEAGSAYWGALARRLG